MKSIFCLATGASILALATAAATVCASAHQVYYPYKAKAARMDPNRLVGHLGAYEGSYVAPKKAQSGTWTDVSTKLPFSNGPWGSMQLTDGTVIMEDYCTSPAQWYKLTPDSKGQYTDGTWSKIAEMPSGYSPLFFAQEILPDGRVIINGGEYNDCNGVWDNQGALYDPVKNSWTSVSPPSGWSTIGDAESVMLPNGTYMLANCCDSPGEQAVASISGTTVTWTTSASYDYNDEQGYTPMPNGDIFMVDVWNLPGNKDDYEIYDTATGVWSLEGQTPDLLTTSQYRELGAAALTPEGPAGGTIIQFGASPSTGENDVYFVSSGKWISGPVTSYEGKAYDAGDAPAATLPDGNVLAQLSPGTYDAPSHFWEFTVSKKSKVKATQVNDTKEAPDTPDFESTMLVLPTGQVIWNNSQTTPNEVAIYTPKGKPKKAWLPVVSSVATTLTVGSTGNAIAGTNFNGFSQGGVYGDDAQQSTNFPLVRITNTSSGDVCFGRSYDFSTMGVWTSGTTNAEFDIPSSCETGASTLQVIVNGIASPGISVTLNS